MTRSVRASLARKVPAWRNMASTRVVLPWSTWAMMAIFRMGVLTGEEFLFFRVAERHCVEMDSLAVTCWLEISGRTTEQCLPYSLTAWVLRGFGLWDRWACVGIHKRTIVGLRPSFSAHVRFGERGAPVHSVRFLDRGLGWRVKSLTPWYPTSREKRARCGAPEVLG
jgi:hypothetical protein